MKARTIVVGLCVLGLALAGGFLALRSYAIGAAEQKLMLVHRNGADTPAQYGVAYTPFVIDSDGRKLQASLVLAQQSCRNTVAVLLFHGRNESISEWAKAQTFLSRQCVSTIVFDYSGNGDSTPPANVANLNADAVAAYAVFVRKFSGGRRCVLGHSMGNAPMLHAYPAFTPAPDCVVVANAFSSVADFARAGGAPAPFVALLTGVWDNTDAIRRVHVPLMVIHSDADKTIPSWMATHVTQAAQTGPAPEITVALRGFGHNALYTDPSLDWWKLVLMFLLDVKPKAASSSVR